MSAKLYGLYNADGRLYATRFYADDDEAEKPPLNAVVVPEDIADIISNNPSVMMDYVLEDDRLVLQSPFSQVAFAKPRQPELLVRVADPVEADVVLDGNQLILQHTHEDEGREFETVRITLTQPNGVPLVTVELDEPVEVDVPGRVQAYALSGAVSTFYQRVKTA